MSFIHSDVQGGSILSGCERTVKFVRGEPVDRPPFMPPAIEWISREQGIPYPASP